MPSKHQYITELYGETISSVVKSVDNWVSFLSASSYHYKYKFSEQILIYAQKPNSTACAEIEVWNKRLGRWVKKGAKGIALIDESGSRMRLRHVFDISDTRDKYNRPFNLWKVEDKYHEEIIENLEARFGELENKETLEYAIISLAKNAVEDNIQDYLHSLIQNKRDSFLEELDDFNIEYKLKTILTNSVAFIMMIRSNTNPFMYFDQSDFKDIIDFNTFETISILGVATSEIAETGLREIQKTVRNIQISEKNQNRTFEQETNKEYNENVNKTKEIERSAENGYSIHNTGRLQPTESTSTRAEINNTREIRENEAEIPERESQRPIHNSIDEKSTTSTSSRDSGNSQQENGTDNARDERASGSDRGIESSRPDEMGANDEQLESDSGGNSDTRANLQLKVYVKDSSRYCPYVVTDDKVNRILSIAPHLRVSNSDIIKYFDNEKSIVNRAMFLKNIFNIEYTELMLGEERYGYKAFENGLLTWKGSYLSRDTETLTSWEDLTEHYQSMILLKQLKDIDTRLPSVTDQMNLIEEKQPELVFSQEFIDRVLQQEGTGSKYDIYKQFQSNLSLKDNADYLKRKYGPYSGRSHTVNGSGIGLEATSKGMTLYRGYLKDRIETTLTWNNVAKRIDELIKLNRYLNSKELEEYPNWNEKQEEKQQLYEASKRLANEKKIETEDLLEEKVPQYEYHLGDTVYIGADKYEILSISDDKVRLYDAKFPLFNQEMSKEEFERKVKENYANEHLKVKKQIVEDKPKEKETETEAVAVTEKQETKKEELESNIIIPNFEKARSRKIQSYDLHPEIKQEDRLNYQIQNDDLGIGTPREKFRRNIEAIKTLKVCEEQNRYATQEEQHILSQYIGWGGLPEVFDEEKSNWANEYLELKNLLTDEEYKQARASTLTAYYTPPVVIRSIYKVLENLRLKEANILEPSCGVGNFLGMLPQTLQNCKMYGIELDSITGRIAQQLYQKSNIAVDAYQRVELPDSFFDAAIGNVPFGENNYIYNKNKFLLHDYFFAKTLDKVRPGGIVAFITSKGTMDKKNPTVRKYLAQRADLLGAIRLPDNTFTKNAGTRVTSDIIILQKREKMTDIMPGWVYLDTDVKGITMNKYFVDNPEMVLGNMVVENTGHGQDTACKPHEDIELSTLLDYAVSNIHGEIEEYFIEDIEEDEKSIVADPNVKNFSYAIVDGQVYFRENSRMYQQDLPVTTTNRIKGMIELRNCVNKLIELQTEDSPEHEIKIEQQKLNRLYDDFVKKYGLINSRGNNLAFSDDSSYYLLCSLEVLDANGKFIRKADIFNKRTIKAYKEITSVETANEALIVSLAEKARVDLEYMSKLSNKTKEELVAELKGVIYKLPLEEDNYVTSDEYLSGNIREKLKLAEKIAETNPEFQEHVEALKKVMPEDLKATEISVKLGATWIPPEIIDQFMYELLGTQNYVQWKIKTRYSENTGEWYIKEKNYDYSNVKANKTYGTDKMNAYKIIEQTLNLKDVKIYDNIVNENGDKERVLNREETAIAQAKQEQIKNKFEEWIWKDQQRREKLEKLYNEKFNSIRPREYDGSHLNFVGMNPEITLRKHQQNAIAHILYGRNTLLAHEVRSRKNI